MSDAGLGKATILLGLAFQVQITWLNFYYKEYCFGKSQHHPEHVKPFDLHVLSHKQRPAWW